VKALVYDRFLSTLGGGERYACSYAMALRDFGYDVTLLADEVVDRGEVEERLRVDLEGVELDTVDPSLSGTVSGRSEGADLFVNVSYLSFHRPLAKHSLLAVHFPEPDVESLVAEGLDAASVVDAFGAPPVGVWTKEARWAPDERVGLGPATRLHLKRVPEGTVLELELPEGSVLATAAVRVLDLHGRVLDHLVLRRGEIEELAVPEAGTPLIVSATGIGWTQATELTPGHSATVFARLRSDRRAPEAAALRLERIASARAYDVVAANSAFTANWVERVWGVRPIILYPAGGSRSPGGTARQQVILNVGRFFPPAKAAHYKGQVELVRAYKALPVELRASWRLVLAGGANPGSETLLAQLRDEAAGHDIEILPNVPGDRLEHLFASASIYWHATGVTGEAPPEMQEHFGITTVEAMSAGLVPVVIDKAGQREIVRDGVDGFRWSDVDELREATARLASDPGLRASMSEAAVRRSDEFSEEAFARRLASVVEGLS